MGFFKAVNALFLDNSAAERAEEARQELLANSKVLVIDDDKNFLEVAAQALTTAGFNVLKSNSGTKGLNVIRYAGSDVKVVLLDYDMPELDGLATLNFLRRFGKQIKVIAITGVEIKFLPTAFREGVDLLFFKPFETQEIVQHIRDYILPDANPAVVPATKGGES